MPFKDKSKDVEFRARYRAEMAAGKRRQEPETLKDALRELRELRKLVQAQRKRIWFLEHKEKHNAQQRQRRRAGFEQNVLSALAAMQERGELPQVPAKRRGAE